jgi:hypothetical protein
MADVTTTTRWPWPALVVASCAAWATRSAEPTEVPPNFITINMESFGPFGSFGSFGPFGSFSF